jgi:predicted subunit of tRNA(5-methylaminomethyl-2-thiouridylate) methyltransferase
MPSNKQHAEPAAQQSAQKIRCFANRFTNITLTKSPECPPASDIEKELRLMQQKRDEQDKKLFGSK